MTTTDAPAARVRRGPAHRAVLAAFTAQGVATGSWGARIPDVKDELDLAEGALGTALLGLSVGAVVGAWTGGLLVRRRGSQRVVTVAWIAVGAGLVLPGLAGSWAALAVAMATLGLALGVVDVAMNGAGVQLEHQAGEPLMSGLHGGWSGGVLLGAGAGAVAVAVDLAVAVHLSLVGLAVVGAAVVAVGAVPDGRIERPVVDPLALLVAVWVAAWSTADQ